MGSDLNVERGHIETHTWAVPRPGLSLVALQALLVLLGNRVLDVDVAGGRILVSHVRARF